MVVIEPWPEGGVTLELRAGPEERAALARRLGLLDLASFEARGRLERGPGSGEVRFRGALEAVLEQECVVTLEPVAAQIRQPVERRWRRVAGVAPPPQEAPAWTVEDDDEEEVELVYGRAIDLGEALAEELALALDPYPRAAGADALVAEDLGPYISFGGAEPADTPFAALRQRKQ
jgi:uncharacterized metal-binding protein YceD (DUF177 family)